MQNLLKNREMLLGLIIIGMILGFTTRAPNFANPDNLVTIFNDTSILIILALGQMVVILTKSIDLSVAANLAFTGMAVAMLDSAYPACRWHSSCSSRSALGPPLARSTASSSGLCRSRRSSSRSAR